MTDRTKTETSKNVLLVKLSSMGDVVHSFPALTEAAAHGYRFDWVVEEAFVELAAMHPAVDRVLAFGLRRWRKDKLKGVTELGQFVRTLRGSKYNQVVDAQGLIKSAFVTRLSGAHQRAGLDAQSAREPASARFYTAPQRISWDLHAIDRLRLLFSKSLGYPTDLSRPVASPFSDSESSTPPVSGAEPFETVLIHGTTWRSKEYPEVAWRELIALLTSAGHSVVVISGSGDEHERALRLCQMAAVGDVSLPAPVALPPGSLMDAARRVQSARLVIGVDSGLTHLAAVLGKPTVGLYGSTSAVRTGVRGPCAVDLASDFECAPCLARVCTYGGKLPRLNGETVVPACFSRLGADRVVETAARLLAS